MAYPIRTILCPMQFDDPELIAFHVAKQLAQQNSATLCLMHVIPIIPAIGEPAVATTVHAREEDKAKQEMQQTANQHLAGVKYQLMTNVAAPAETAHAILRAAKDANADLIVMKTHGRHGLAHLILGSVAEQVVRESPCAVLTLTSSAKQRFTTP